MRVAFIVYAGITALDFIGVYEPVTNLKVMGFLPDLEWEITALAHIYDAGAGVICDDTRLHLLPTEVGKSLQSFDMIIVPGGLGSRKMMHDPEFIAWLRTALPCTWKVSVCTGALLLGAAGFLIGKEATTHPRAFTDLQAYCVTVIKDQRIVEAGDVITARGVTTAIDLGLYLCKKLAGDEANEQIRRLIDYIPQGDCA